MGGVRDGRLVHAVDVQAVHAVCGKVLKLLAGVLDARARLVCGVVPGVNEALDHLGGNGGAAGEGHALDLLHAGEGHDAGHNGQLHAVTQALLAEAVEVLVVKEERVTK